MFRTIEEKADEYFKPFEKKGFKQREPDHTMEYTFKEMLKYGEKKLYGYVHQIKDGKKIPIVDWSLCADLQGWDGNMRNEASFIVSHKLSKNYMDDDGNAGNYTDEKGYYEFNHLLVGEYKVYLIGAGTYDGFFNARVKIEPSDKSVRKDIIISGDYYDFEFKFLDIDTGNYSPTSNFEKIANLKPGMYEVKLKCRKNIHKGDYVAEVEVELIDTDEGWTPYILFVPVPTENTYSTSPVFLRTGR